jgi:hypothetical protein
VLRTEEECEEFLGRHAVKCTPVRNQGQGGKRRYTMRPRFRRTAPHRLPALIDTPRRPA